MLHISFSKPTLHQHPEPTRPAIPLASSFNLCTETSNDSLSSNSLSKNAFLSIAWFSLCSKSSNETIVALETKSRILGSSAQSASILFLNKSLFKSTAEGKWQQGYLQGKHLKAMEMLLRKESSTPKEKREKMRRT